MEPFEIIIDREQSGKGYKNPFLLSLGILVLIVNTGIIIKELVYMEFSKEFPGSWVYLGNALLGLAIILGYFRRINSRSIRFDGSNFSFQPERNKETVQFKVNEIVEIRHYATSAEVRLLNGDKHLIPLGQLNYLDVQRVKALLTDNPNQEK